MENRRSVILRVETRIFAFKKILVCAVLVRKMNWISNDKMHSSFERINLVSN